MLPRGQNRDQDHIRVTALIHTRAPPLCYLQVAWASYMPTTGVKGQDQAQGPGVRGVPHSLMLTRKPGPPGRRPQRGLCPG